MQRASHSKAVTNTIESAMPLHPYSAIISCPDVSRRIHLSCKRLFNLESMTSESHVISRVNHALTGHSFGAQKSSRISMGASGGAWLVRDQRDARTYTGMKVDVIRSRAQMILSLSCIEDIADCICQDARRYSTLGACPLRTMDCESLVTLSLEVLLEPNISLHLYSSKWRCTTVGRYVYDWESGDCTTRWRKTIIVSPT
jgi:hypothetical protein